MGCGERIIRWRVEHGRESLLQHSQNVRAFEAGRLWQRATDWNRLQTCRRVWRALRALMLTAHRLERMERQQQQNAAALARTAHTREKRARQRTNMRLAILRPAWDRWRLYDRTYDAMSMRRRVWTERRRMGDTPTVFDSGSTQHVIDDPDLTNKHTTTGVGPIGTNRVIPRPVGNDNNTGNESIEMQADNASLASRFVRALWSLVVVIATMAYVFVQLVVHVPKELNTVLTSEEATRQESEASTDAETPVSESLIGSSDEAAVAARVQAVRRSLIEEAAMFARAAASSLDEHSPCNDSDDHVDSVSVGASSGPSSPLSAPRTVAQIQNLSEWRSIPEGYESSAAQNPTVTEWVEQLGQRESDCDSDNNTCWNSDVSSEREMEHAVLTGQCVEADSPVLPGSDLADEDGVLNPYVISPAHAHALLHGSTATELPVSDSENTRDTNDGQSSTDVQPALPMPTFDAPPQVCECGLNPTLWTVQRSTSNHA